MVMTEALDRPKLKPVMFPMTRTGSDAQNPKKSHSLAFSQSR